MANYFEVLFANCSGTQGVAIISTDKESPKETNYSFATGFNGCKIIDYKETDREHFRSNKRQFFKISGDI